MSKLLSSDAPYLIVLNFVGSSLIIKMVCLELLGFFLSDVVMLIPKLIHLLFLSASSSLVKEIIKFGLLCFCFYPTLYFEPRSAAKYLIFARVNMKQIKYFVVS